MKQEMSLNELNSLLKREWKTKIDGFEYIEPFLDEITKEDYTEKLLKQCKQNKKTKRKHDG